MDFTGIAAILIVCLTFIVLICLRKSIIFEYQRGLLYRGGKFVKIMQPGAHWYINLNQSIQKVDIRARYVTIPGQEMLTSDTIGVKMSLAVSYRVVDPYLALNRVTNYQDVLYLLIQLNLREIVGELAMDDLMEKRGEIGKMLFERSVPQAVEIGLELQKANIKDIMLPGELKNIYAQVVNARKEGMAALERARGESAALRNLANAARMLEETPNLLQLRFLQGLENHPGNVVVLVPQEGFTGLQTRSKKNGQEAK